MKPTELAERTRPVMLALGAASLVLNAGCQSTSIDNSITMRPGTNTALEPATSDVARVAKTRPVVVRDFLFDVAQLHKDPGLLARREGPAKRVLGSQHPQETSVQKAERLSHMLSETIVKELANLKITASRDTPGSPWPANAIVVAGQFMEVDEGNRLRRAMVGFNSGATDVLVQVAVYDLLQSRDHPVLVYGTGTGSKPAPGAVVMMNPYAMAARYVLSRNATDKDVRALGKHIAKDLAQIESGGTGDES